MKYAFMQDHSGEFKITSMSRVLGVSRSGFYRFRQRGEQPTRRQQERMVLDKLVADAESQPTPEARWDMFMQAEDVLVDDAVIIPLYQRGASTLLNPAVKGYTLNATSPDVFFKHISMD